MSDRLVSISIDVTLLDKKRFVPGKKANAKGLTPQYVNLDLRLLENPKFDNNYLLTERASKEERMAKVKMQIVGNGKTIFGSDDKVQKRPKQQANTDPDEKDDVPF